MRFCSLSEHVGHLFLLVAALEPEPRHVRARGHLWGEGGVCAVLSTCMRRGTVGTHTHLAGAQSDVVETVSHLWGVTAPW